MAYSLQDRIHVLALHFAEQVLAELHGASLEDILDGGRRRAPAVRPPYSERGNGTEADIVALVKKFASNGVRARMIRAELGLTATSFHYHVNKALKSKSIRKTGQKRGTIYYPVQL